MSSTPGFAPSWMRVVKERQFLDYSSYIAKVGRGRFVEIHVLVSPGIPNRY